MTPLVTLSRRRPALLQGGQGLANGVRGSLLLLGNCGLFPGFRLPRHQKRGNRTPRPQAQSQHRQRRLCPWSLLPLVLEGQEFETTQPQDLGRTQQVPLRPGRASRLPRESLALPPIQSPGHCSPTDAA